MHEMPVFLVEDIWQAVQGPRTLAELAVEQKESNTRLVEHHYVFCTLLHAILVYSLKSIKPLSLYDTKVFSRISVLLVSSCYLAVQLVGCIVHCHQCLSVCTNSRTKLTCITLVLLYLYFVRFRVLIAISLCMYSKLTVLLVHVVDAYRQVKFCHHLFYLSQQQVDVGSDRQVLLRVARFATTKYGRFLSIQVNVPPISMDTYNWQPATNYILAV